MPDDWLTTAMVADHLGDETLALLPAMTAACNAVRAYLEHSSPFLATDPGTAEVSMIVESVQLGAILWAAHIYQTRSAPSGFAGYGEGAGDGMFDLSLASNRADIWRLTGLKRPLAI